MPVGLAYDSGNGYVYVANAGSDNVSVISGTTVVATVPVGDDPIGVAYDSGNGYVYVTNDNSNNVSVISTTTPSPWSPPPIFLGLPAAEGYALLAGIVMVVVAVGVVFAIHRVRRKRRAPPTPPLRRTVPPQHHVVECPRDC